MAPSEPPIVPITAMLTLDQNDSIPSPLDQNDPTPPTELPPPPAGLPSPAVREERLIAALETTMEDLSFTADSAGNMTIASPPEEVVSILELTPPTTPKITSAAAQALPMELVCAIVSYLPPDDQESYAACAKVSRQWYFASAQYLYASPKITPRNFSRFVSTISPSSTNVKPSPLANLVCKLDLSAIVNEGKKSYTARLLRRTQDNLEEFVAAQTSFGYLCLVALGHCRKLRSLDLSRITQSVPLENLFTHIQNLPSLRILHFPRSSVFTTRRYSFHWPPRLEKFALAGSVSNTFLHETAIPSTLNELHISHCPFTTHESVLHLLRTLAPQLTRLSVGIYIPRLPFDGLDRVLLLCPGLRSLLVAVDYISARFFDECNAPAEHPLRELFLESSGNLGTELKISPNDAYIAVGEGRLRNLRAVKATSRLGWAERERTDVKDLDELLVARARDCGEAAGAGVEEFESDVHGGAQRWCDFGE